MQNLRKEGKVKKPVKPVISENIYFTGFLINFNGKYGNEFRY